MIITIIEKKKKEKKVKRCKSNRIEMQIQKDYKYNETARTNVSMQTIFSQPARISCELTTIARVILKFTFKNIDEGRVTNVGRNTVS